MESVGPWHVWPNTPFHFHLTVSDVDGQNDQRHLLLHTYELYTHQIAVSISPPCQTNDTQSRQY